MNPEFTALVDDDDGVRITDPIERTRFDLHVPSAVVPELTDTESFYFPVDKAAAVETPWVETTKGLDVYVRDVDGELVGQATTGTDLDLPADAYNLELATTKMKVYLAVESEVHVSGDAEAVRVGFGGETRVEIGARSLHERPAGTITVPDDVGATMDAVSLLGSALKVTSCERSFPSLRGHPPMLTPGEEFTVEGEISRPETGVTLEVPETREAVYEVAPLAFYLGADVVPGDPPRLRAGEFTHRLDRAGDLQTGVKRVLQQVFFLDCVTRTEGTYKVDLRERAELEPHVDLDFEALYGAPLAEQLRAYLEIPYEVIEPHLPEWKATIDMPSDHSTVKVLPHALDDLAVIRCPDEPDPSKVDPEPQALTNFYRGASDDDPRNVVQPEPADSIEHLWVGEEMAIGASKVTPEVLARRLDATPRDEISVEVVCNHGVLDEARVVEDVYGRADYEFEVGVHEAVSTAELRELLESETDFLHFIGHVTEAGIKCPDGLLDVSELDEVGVRGFFLNGCRSYDQGELLVEKGSHAGIVTMATVADEQAADLGEDVARLLNHGFPMQSALSIATDANMPSEQYLTVGDAGIELCELKCGTPVVLRAEKKEDTISMELERYPTTTSTIGTFTTTKISGDEICSLNSSVLQANVDCESVQDFFDESTHAVQLEDRLAWTDDIAVEDL